MTRSRAASAPPSYAWLLDVLSGGTPAVRWAAAGKLPDGFEIVEQLAVLPATSGRSLLVSLKSRRGASFAVTSYNALRSPRWRLARRMLGAGLRTGLAQPLLPSKIDVGMAVNAPGEQYGVLLTEHLRELFGRGPVVVALSGGDGPYRKPVLQVFSMDGTQLGFVKVGWNAWTRDAVRREAAVLRACAQSGPMRFGVPALLDHYIWRGLDLLVTAPLPLGVRRLRTSSALPDISVLHEVSRLSQPYVGELATSPWWLGLRARIAAHVADPAVRTELDEVADSIERSDGHATLEFGTWHGDFVPWNLVRLERRLFALDWEDTAPQVPVGFDALHFHFQVAFVARRRPLEEAALAGLKARPALDALGVASAAYRLVASLHLLELFVRHEEARSSAGRADDRFYPAVLRALNQMLLVPPGTSRLRSSRRSS